MEAPENPLETFFRDHDGYAINKWVHYLEIYHRHFQRFRGTAPTVLEFGVNQGGSLQMWRDYFGEDARIHGVDINPRCRFLRSPGTRIHIGDQEDRDFLRSLLEETGPVDVLIEDGGHRYGQQVATFEVCYPAMSENGVFLIEDLHTSYWPKYGGGVFRQDTFMNYAKGLTDQLNAWHSRQPRKFAVDDFTRTTRSMHFYDSVVVFERGVVEPPRAERRGHPTVADRRWRPPRPWQT